MLGSTLPCFVSFALIALLFDVGVARRHRRHHHSRQFGTTATGRLSLARARKETAIGCEQGCQAQFEADYQTEFGNFYYELHWFPLHHLLTQSEQKLHSFCEFVQERKACLRKCGAVEEPWSPLQHICIDHQQSMISILPCLRATSDMVGCTSMCKRFAHRYREFLHESTDGGVSDSFEARSLTCFYQMCILECRVRLTEDECSDSEADSAKSFLRRYYADDAFHEALKHSPTPNLCKRLMSQDTSRPLPVHTHQLDSLDDSMIREMRDRLDQVSRRSATT